MHSVKGKTCNFQMHPVLRQMKPPPRHENYLSSAAVDMDMPEEGEGIARLTSDPDKHPRVAIKKDSSEAFIPKANLARDDSGQYPEYVRDLRLRAGREMVLDPEYKVTDDDFKITSNDVPISRARAHLEAASLASSYQQTVKDERNFQESFNNHVRTLLTRDEVTTGMLHLWDFVEAFLTNPTSKSLTAQLFLIVQHSRDDGIFKESLMNIAEPEGRWLLDLINVLQSIIVQEHNLPIAEKVAAINYAAMSLGKFYARKIYDSPFVPLDKEVKITTFYMRMILKLLTLADDLGIYRNERMERVVSSARSKEFSDVELMKHLRRALTSPEYETVQEEEDDEY